MPLCRDINCFGIRYLASQARARALPPWLTGRIGILGPQILKDQANRHPLGGNGVHSEAADPL